MTAWFGGTEKALRQRRDENGVGIVSGVYATNHGYSGLWENHAPKSYLVRAEITQRTGDS